MSQSESSNTVSSVFYLIFRTHYFEKVRPGTGEEVQRHRVGVKSIKCAANPTAFRRRWRRSGPPLLCGNCGQDVLGGRPPQDLLTPHLELIYFTSYHPKLSYH